MLKIYNSLKRKKEPFKTIDSHKVKIYVCGMTVYDYCHIGHARTVTSFDIIVRYLRNRGYLVNYVRNITDIDDKIIDKSIQKNVSVESLTNKMIKAMQEDFSVLGNLSPDQEPKATDYVLKMQYMISELMEKEFAYSASNGDVYFRVHKFEDYGKLSGKRLDDLNAGARVDVDPFKENPMDFVLWKHTKEGEPYWDSPWGKGRPGWHIECSTMCKHCLGESFDIHGGGSDLQFPHHENEIAQSEANNGKKLANFWMHSGAIRVDNVKMSKSLGNYSTIREVLQEYSPEVIRLFLISSHYRSTVNFSNQSLEHANQGLERLYNSLKQLNISESEPIEESEYERRFYEAMNDDFNTPVAISVLFELTKQINILKQQENLVLANSYGSLLIKLASILGLLKQDDPPHFQKKSHIDQAWVMEMIQQRNEAKSNKNFKLSDQIRNQLLEKGIRLQDTPAGTNWEVK